MIRNKIDRGFEPISAARRRTKALLTLALGALSLGAVAPAQTSNSYQVTNLISDGSVTAATTDPNFINPWGIGIGGAFWISGETSLRALTVRSSTNRWFAWPCS